MIAEVRITPYQNLIETVIVGSQGLSESVESAVLSSSMLVWCYLIGVFIFSMLFLYRSVQLWRLIKTSKVISSDGYKLVVVDEPVSPFSFQKYLFVSSDFEDKEGNQRMLLHEMEHIKQGHTFDVIILEILIVFQWFNPFVWLLRRAIRENHEYLADKAVLESGAHPDEYKKLLLTQYVGGPLMATSHFNYSLVKNRINMMTKMQSPRLALAKLFAGLILSTGLILLFACEHRESGRWSASDGMVLKQRLDSSRGNTVVAVFYSDTLQIEGTDEELSKIEEFISSKKLSAVREAGSNRMLLVSLGEKIDEDTNNRPEPSGSDEQVFFIVEEMPEFPGGEAALRNFIASNVRYPAIAQENGIEGRVYVSFVVSSDGTIKDASVARGVDPALDREALRVVRSLPRWKPGVQRGKAVNVSYTVPINFSLQ